MSCALRHFNCLLRGCRLKLLSMVLLFVFVCEFIHHCDAVYSITDESRKAANGEIVLLKRISNLATNESALVITNPGGRLEQLLLRGGVPPLA